MLGAIDVGSSAWLLVGCSAERAPRPDSRIVDRLRRLTVPTQHRGATSTPCPTTPSTAAPRPPLPTRQPAEAPAVPTRNPALDQQLIDAAWANDVALATQLIAAARTSTPRTPPCRAPT